MKRTHLLVTEGEKEICKVELPINVADAIEDLFPDETRRKIEALGFDFSKASEQAKNSEYKAQTLMDISTDVRRYLVWIE